MITGNERAIIVLGMAHSGTTILTYLLQQHPDVVCVADGSEAWLLENTWLPHAKTETLQNSLNKHQNKRLILKRPWVERHQGDWLKTELPNAYYIYSQRPLQNIKESWQNPHTSKVKNELKFGTDEFVDNFYHTSLKMSQDFSQGIQNFFWHQHANLLIQPENTINTIINWLGLPPHQIDTSLVNTKNIKTLLGLKFHTRPLKRIITP